MQEPPPFWLPGAYAVRRPLLRARGAITAAVRAWFAAHDFVEVETAALQVSPGNETHLHAFATELIGPGGERQPLYLRTSPEFACKKLLAAGEKRIFEFARVFRNRERGALHHPEFTMLEWYRANQPYETLMDDCAALLAEAARAAGAKHFTFRGKTVDPHAAPERLTVAEAFARHAGVDLLATVAGGQGDAEKLAACGCQGRRRHGGRRYLERYLQPHSGRADRARISASAARHYYMSTRCRWRRWRGQNRAVPKSPSVSSSMPAG